MKFKKIKSFKCINHFRTRKINGDPDSSSFKKRSYEIHHKDQWGLGNTQTQFLYFPYCDEIEKLYKTIYDKNVPFAKFNADSLLLEEKQFNKLISECFDNNDQAQNIGDYISNYFTISPDLGKETSIREDPIFSFFLLNEYLHQEKIDTYGDFIESKGDEVYDEKFYNLDLLVGEHTYEIFDLFKDIIGSQKYSSIQCFTVGSRTTKKIVDLFKTITKEEMIQIVDEYSSNPDDLCSNFSAQYILVSSVLEKIRNNETKISKSKVLDKISEIFVQLLYKTNKNYTLENISILSLHLNKFKAFIVDDATKSSSTKIYSNRVYKILEIVENNIDQIRIEEFMAFIKTIMSNHECFMRSGNNDKTIELMELALNNSEETLISFVNIIGETFLYHVKNNDNLLPTYSDWKNELSKEDNSLNIPYSLLIPMIAKDKKGKNNYYYEIEDIRKFKEIVLS